MELLQELIKIDHQAEMPVYIQITNAFIHHIRAGRLRKGLRLPGSREVATLLGINRMTMVAAYDELKAQGWIEMLPRTGTFVTQDLPVLKPGRIKEEEKVFTIPAKPSFHFDEKHIIPVFSSDFPEGGKIILNDGFPDSRLAPVERLVSSMRSLVRLATQRKYFMYGGAQGTEKLRHILADFLSDTRGLPVSPANILVTRGAQQGIYLAAHTLLQPGDHVVVGEPGYAGANLIFRYTGAKIISVPVDEEGMDIDKLEDICKKKKIKLVYVIPHHHHPTTVTLTPERRIRLLELAAKYKFALIEDDYDYDFHYASKPIMPMASLDRHGSVIYIGTLTKTLAPAIRVGFMVAPEQFTTAATHLRKAVDTQGDSLLENALADLYKDGTIGRHIRKSVKLYKERRDHFCNLLRTELGAHVSFKIPDGGMSVWTKFLSADTMELSANAYRKGLVMGNSRDYDTYPKRYNSVRMGFASLNFREQEKAVDILKGLLR
ncbi:MAG TPA: PLP-dependent aminotransferase family protein [Chitinophaga sp.]|uniref:MocR-like pyridoxine biosynthesis transcription factor PdxR n=1 Tax=Chitinophaga sp. TaxID=1869181 RepID=UPI002B9502E0|nr:PLP-dependent aminotransferase family protein [Chitinophaga sp.]HVI44166.1 PLP-dependent aminotransferase family protein [Chitinophaga sp.]